MHGRAAGVIGARFRSWNGCRALASMDGSRLDFGKHKGLTFEECWRQHPDYCGWLLQQPDNPRTAGFREFVESQRSPSSMRQPLVSHAGRKEYTQTSAPQAASRSHRQFEQPAVRPNAARSEDFSGEAVTFGKYKGKSFEEVFESDPNYSQWILESAKKPDASPNLKAFSAFVQQRSGSSGDVNASREPEAVQRSPAVSQGGGASSHGAVLSFGKHKGKSFEEICRTDAQYCQWIVQSAGKPDASADGKALAAFVQERFPEILTASPAGRKEFSKPATKWPRPRSTESDKHTVSSGMKTLGGGKHAERTYADVFETDTNYCRFLVGHGLSGTSTSAWFFPFIAYVQQRWLLERAMPPETFACTGKKGCLKGASYAVTGTPAEMTRQTLDSLIAFFGGRVASAVSSKTSCLIHAGKGIDGKAAEAGEKYHKAQQHGIPVISVADFLNEHIQNTCEDGEQDTFESDGHARGEEQV